MTAAVVRLAHGKLELALHPLREGGRPGLLLLHGLGESSPAGLPPELAEWPGSVHALDFTGHGASDVPAAGGYKAEALMADSDCALQHLGPSTVVGRGLGAYVALLLAGARPKRVRGAVLRDGLGLAGGGPRPATVRVVHPEPEPRGAPDPYALAELARDPRPPDYAGSYAHQATHLSDLPQPLSVCCFERPPWLQAVLEEPGVEETSLARALALYAGSV